MLAVPPLNYGDLAALGFSHWTPAGIAQWTLELIQVSSGMPWFWAIVAATVLSRIIVIPLNIGALRTSARLAPYQPRLMQLRGELEKTGGLNKDPMAVQRITLQQKQIYEEAGASLVAPIATPFVQIPVSIGLFVGIKRLCDFPLEQLKVGGYGWITDLTVPDPTFALPLAMMALINIQLSVSNRSYAIPPPKNLLTFVLRLVQRTSRRMVPKRCTCLIYSRPLHSFLHPSCLTSPRYSPLLSSLSIHRF